MFTTATFLGYIVAGPIGAFLATVARAGIAATLRRLAGERGLAVLFITHDLGEAMHACDRVAVLRQGEITETGRPTRLTENPEHPYTAELVAAGHRRALQPR